MGTEHGWLWNHGVWVGNTMGNQFSVSSCARGKTQLDCLFDRKMTDFPHVLGTPRWSELSTFRCYFLVLPPFSVFAEVQNWRQVRHSRRIQGTRDTFRAERADVSLEFLERSGNHQVGGRRDSFHDETGGAAWRSGHVGIVLYVFQSGLVFVSANLLLSDQNSQHDHWNSAEILQGTFGPEFQIVYLPQSHGLGTSALRLRDPDPGRGSDVRPRSHPGRFHGVWMERQHCGDLGSGETWWNRKVLDQCWTCCCLNVLFWGGRPLEPKDSLIMCLVSSQSSILWYLNGTVIKTKQGVLKPRLTLKNAVSPVSSWRSSRARRTETCASSIKDESGTKKIGKSNLPTGWLKHVETYSEQVWGGLCENRFGHHSSVACCAMRHERGPWRTFGVTRDEARSIDFLGLWSRENLRTIRVPSNGNWWDLS